MREVIGTVGAVRVSIDDGVTEQIAALPGARSARIKIVVESYGFDREFAPVVAALIIAAAAVAQAREIKREGEAQ